MEAKNQTFGDVLYSWGLFVLVALALVLTLAEYINGYTGGFKEWATELLFNLVYAGVYIIIRLIPIADDRVPFWPKKKEQ